MLVINSELYRIFSTVEFGAGHFLWQQSEEIAHSHRRFQYVASLEWNQRVGASPGIECAIDMLDDAQTIVPASEEGE